MFIFFYIADTLITDVKDMYKNPHIITFFLHTKPVLYNYNQDYMATIRKNILRKKI